MLISYKKVNSLKLKSLKEKVVRMLNWLFDQFMLLKLKKSIKQILLILKSNKNIWRTCA